LLTVERVVNVLPQLHVTWISLYCGWIPVFIKHLCDGPIEAPLPPQRLVVKLLNIFNGLPTDTQPKRRIMRGFALHCNTVTNRWSRTRRVQGLAHGGLVSPVVIQTLKSKNYDAEGQKRGPPEGGGAKL
jgi:hypothetical protein